MCSAPSEADTLAWGTPPETQAFDQSGRRMEASGNYEVLLLSLELVTSCAFELSHYPKWWHLAEASKCQVLNQLKLSSHLRTHQVTEDIRNLQNSFHVCQRSGSINLYEDGERC